MTTRPYVYRIRVLSHLDKHWRRDPVVRMRHGRDTEKRAVTSLDIQVADQAELVGVLGDLCGLGMQVTYMRLLRGAGDQQVAG
jgi:hypothetical protein